MPIMQRPTKKARKIFYGILGKPANIAFKPTPTQARINEMLMQQNSRFAR